MFQGRDFERRPALGLSRGLAKTPHSNPRVSVSLDLERSLRKDMCRVPGIISAAGLCPVLKVLPGVTRPAMELLGKALSCPLLSPGAHGV